MHKEDFTTRNVGYRQKQRNLNYCVGILNHPFCVMEKNQIDILKRQYIQINQAKGHAVTKKKEIFR